MENDTQQTNRKNDAAAQKPKAPQPGGKKADGPGRTGGERPSLSEERAEGEGMIAPPDADQAMEGEGSYKATRRYNESVAKSVAEGDTEKLARKAAQALDGHEGSELRKAEQAAKQGHST